jgi:hypothetical protein
MTSSPRQFVADLNALGVMFSLSPSGGIAVAAPRGIIDAVILEAIRRLKAPIVSLLEAEGPGAGRDALRWGPGIGDPTAGLVVAHPDPDRRRIALENLSSDIGDAWESPTESAGDVPALPHLPGTVSRAEIQTSIEFEREAAENHSKINHS